MKQSALVVIIVIIIAVAAVAGSFYYLSYMQPKSSGTATNLVFALPASPTSEAIPAYVAVHGGFWKQLGLNVTLGVYTGSAMPDAISAGQIQFGFVSFLTGFNFAGKGIPIKYVGVGDIPNAMVLIVGNSSKYHSVQDLNGGSVGVTSLGTLTDVMFHILKSYYNLNIKEVALGGLQAQLAALQTNKSQAFFWTYDQGYVLENQGVARILANTTTISGNWVNDGIFSTNSVIQNNPGLVKKVLQGWLNAVAYCTANQTYCIQQTMAYMNAPQPVAKNIVLQDFFSPGNFSSDGAFTPAIQTSLDHIRSIDLQFNLSSSLPPSSSMYTTQFTPLAPQNVKPSMEIIEGASGSVMVAVPAEFAARKG
jgi:ABC-type nitrate/sulfonate/bicarbonate transport system substrate-binding protein